MGKKNGNLTSAKKAKNDEIWKDISGYEGHYQINNYGRTRIKTTY